MEVWRVRRSAPCSLRGKGSGLVLDARHAAAAARGRQRKNEYPT